MAAFPEKRGYQLSVVPPYHGSRSGIQVATKVPPDASDEYLAFVNQLGVEWGMCYDPLPPTVEVLRAVRERYWHPSRRSSRARARRGAPAHFQQLPRV